MKSDSQLYMDIAEQLCFKKAIEPDHIKFCVENGIATFNGLVDTYKEKRLVKQTISNIYGVRGSIINEIIVKPINDTLIPTLLR